MSFLRRKKVSISEEELQARMKDFLVIKEVEPSFRVIVES